MGFGCPYCGWCKLSLDFSSGRFLLEDQCEHLVLGHAAFQNSTQLWKHPVMGRILPSEQVRDLLPPLRLLPSLDATRFLLSWLFDGRRPSGYIPPTAASLQRSTHYTEQMCWESSILFSEDPELLVKQLLDHFATRHDLGLGG